VAVLRVVAVRDRALEAFMRPFFVPAVGQAIRSFQDEVNRVDKDNAINAHPADYDLWYLADFDEESGKFVGGDGFPKQVAIGKQCVLKGEG